MQPLITGISAPKYRVFLESSTELGFKRKTVIKPQVFFSEGVAVGCDGECPWPN